MARGSIARKPGIMGSMEWGERYWVVFRTSSATRVAVPVSPPPELEHDPMAMAAAMEAEARNALGREFQGADKFLVIGTRCCTRADLWRRRN
jgi:hypothetical protein